MLNIGIDTNTGLIYEGQSDYGRGIWPSPVISRAKFVFPSEGDLSANHTTVFGYRFREDSFDPVSRIRRGRFYNSGQSSSNTWYVQPHLAIPLELPEQGNKQIIKRLETFYGCSIWNQYFSKKGVPPLVLLGVDERYTVWSVISIEVISTGEELVTLKARSAMGVLPNINQDMIPKQFMNVVNESLETLVDEVHRSAPASVIDRARDAVTQVLLAFFTLEGKQAKELKDLIKMLENREYAIAAAAAKIISRLHARAKPNERAKYDLRSVREQDAEFAAQCVGTLLCEIGWGDW